MNLEASGHRGHFRSPRGNPEAELHPPRPTRPVTAGSCCPAGRRALPAVDAGSAGRKMPPI